MGQFPASEVCAGTRIGSNAGSCGTTLCGKQGRLEIAAEGGADRRSAKIADRPMNQSREAHPLGLAAPFPRGGTHQPELRLGGQGRCSGCLRRDRTRG
jgi:hypothetical protein